MRKHAVDVAEVSEGKQNLEKQIYEITIANNERQSRLLAISQRQIEDPIQFQGFGFDTPNPIDTLTPSQTVTHSSHEQRGTDIDNISHQLLPFSDDSDEFGDLNNQLPFEEEDLNMARRLSSFAFKKC